MARKIRLLRAQDLEGILRMTDVIELVHEAFAERGRGRTQMPAKSYLRFTEHEGVLLSMPGHMPARDEAAVKLITMHKKNAPLHRLPTLLSTIVLVSPDTGETVCIMDGNYVTGMRTGAVSGVASRLLARKDSRILGIVGAGFQGPFHLEAVRNVLPIEEVLVHDLVSEKSSRLADKATSLGLRGRACISVEEVVKASDVLVTLTPSEEPIVKDEWVREGTHLNCIGSYAAGKQEVDPAILRRALVVVDDWEQCSHAGEINVPLRKGEFDRSGVRAELPEIAAGLKPGRTDERTITVFDSTGLAIQDVVTAWAAFREAEHRGLGIEIDALYV